MTTHSNFVANKLGLDNLILLSNKRCTPFNSLHSDDVNYFKKLPGYDTLRLILSRAAILVEGPSDELIVQREYKDKFGLLPIEHGVDVISVRGLSFKRFLDIARRIGRKVAAITDNDSDYQKNVKDKYVNYDDVDCIEIFADPRNELNTLEPQFIDANIAIFDDLRKTIGLREDKYPDRDSVLRYMINNKAEWALKVFEDSQSFNYPQSLVSHFNGTLMIFPNIFIDEIQDLAGYDLDILKLLFKSESTILCVGDPRQITYLTHWEKKNRKYQCGQIKAFVNDECIKHRNLDKIVIDEELLSRSHRNNSLICEFSSKLYPQYNATKTCDCDGCHPKDIEHQGVFLVKQKDLNEYMRLYHPVQLRNSRLVKVDERHRAYNYGQSKGMTCIRVIIYPTGPIVTWLKDHDSELMPTSRADLYVAVTRARFSVAFVIPDEVCEEIRDLPVWVNEINQPG